MKLVEFDMANGNRIALFLGAGNFAVTECDRENGKPIMCCIADGVHNNGGWKVIGSYSTILVKIDKAFGA